MTRRSRAMLFVNEDSISMSKSETSAKKSSGKSSDTKSSDSKSSDAKSSDTKSSDAKSTKSSGSGGKSAKASVGGAAAVHYGYFSSVRSDEYRSGWDDIWKKKSRRCLWQSRPHYRNP